MKKFHKLNQAIILTCLMMLGSQSLFAQASNIDQASLMQLKNTMQGLSSGKLLSATVEYGYDVVQKNGQKIEYGGTRSVIYDRPTRMRIENKARDGVEHVITYDGNNLVFTTPKLNFYSLKPIKGNIADALQFLDDEMGVPMPMTNFFAVNSGPSAFSDITGAEFVDKSIIEGVVCDHLALRTKDVDYQVWIAENDTSFPYRYVITYKNEPGQPQFWAQFKNWNTSPYISERQFTYQPNKQSRRIAFESDAPDAPTENSTVNTEKKK